MFNKRNNRKAQITIFIILGIILLFIAAFVYYMYSIREQVPEAEIEEAIEEAPVEVKPIVSFVQQCITEVATDGVNEIGRHGGYIDMNDEEISGRTFTIDLQKPTASDAVAFNMDPSTHVAYWWHLKSANNCFNCQLSNQNAPSIGSMELQLEKYIKRELDSCIGSFRDFTSIGYDIIMTANSSVDVTIAEDDITVLTTYPIRATIDNRSTDVSRFFLRIPLDIREFYGLAREITRGEVDQNFLEEIFLYLLSVYSSADMQRLPPVFAREFGSFKKFWIKTMIEQNIEEILGVYTPLIQLNGTKNGQRYVVGNSSDPQGYYNLFYRDVLNSSYEEYSVSFFYFGQPIYLETSPGGKRPSVSEVKTRELTFFGLSFGSPFEENIYEYLYDVSFPVIVEIKKEDALYDKPYTFYFALEANVRNNKAIRDWMAGNGTMAPFDRSKLSASPKAEVLMDEQSENISFIDGNITKSLFCRPSQRISGNVTIRTVDAEDGSPVDNVQVKFGCGDHRSCPVGSTRLDVISNESVLVTQLPICVGGGYLRLTKAGYREKIVPKITTKLNETQEFDVNLDRIVRLNVSVKRFVLDRISVLYDSDYALSHEVDKWLSWNSTVQKLNSSDQLMLSVKKIDDQPYETPFSKTLVIYGNDSLNTPDFAVLELVPGKYSLEGIYQDTAGVVFPANCSHECGECDTDYCEDMCYEHPYDYQDYCSEYSAVSAVFTAGLWACATCGDCDTDQFMPDDNTSIKPAILGGLEINESDPWTVDYSDLESADSVEFYVLSAPVPRCFDDMNETEEMKEFYSLRRSDLEPRFTE